MKKPLPVRCCTIDITPDQEDRLVSMSHAMGNPLRFEILKYLLVHPGCITGDIVDVLPISQSTTSVHLKVLKDAGWICGTVEGTATNYCLDQENLNWYQNTIALAFGNEQGV
jgi:ArsR family transcriptional regulator